MRKILLSMNPLSISKLASKEKSFIYRKRAAKKDVNKIIIYSTSPIKKIVGEANLKKILCFSPNDLWEKTKQGSGMVKSLYDMYFFNKKIAYAYEISSFKYYKKPIPLSEFGLKYPPQFFYYLD